MRKAMLVLVLLMVFILVSKAGCTTDCNCDNFTGNLTIGGTVGIATSTPGTSITLDVAGTIRAGGDSYKKVAIVNKGETTNWVIGDNPWSWGAGKFYIAVDENNTPEFTLQSDGKVGIGLTPAYKLQTSGTDAAYGDTSAIFGIKGDSGTELSAGIYETGNYAWIRAYEANVSFRNLALQPDGGKVGIRTTNPGSELEVNGTIAIDTGGATDHKLFNSSGNLVINSSGVGGDVIIKLGQQ